MRRLLGLVAGLLVGFNASAIIKNQPPASGGGGGSGTVTSVAASATAPLCVSGGPVTISGTLTFTWCGSETANQFLATPNGVAGAASMRSIVLADLPSGIGTVTSASVVSANGLSGSVATSTTTPAITLSTSITGPLKGAAGALAAASASDIYGLFGCTGVAGTYLTGAGACGASTGTGNVVLSSSPSLTTPALDTPSAINLANATNLTAVTLESTIAGLSAAAVLTGTEQIPCVQSLAAVYCTPAQITTYVNANGAPNVSNATGTLGVTHGGDGLVTATLGDMRYGSATNTLAVLAGNTTTTPEVLSQTGTGLASAAPAWMALTAGTSSAVDVQVFTSSGTWTAAAASYKFVRVIAVGGGGGGGGGITTTSGTAASGGGGGGGGYIGIKDFTAAEVSSPQTVTVAGAATGGSPGSSGSQGGSSSFGSLAYAFGGGGGSSGQVGAGSGGGGGGGSGAAGSNASGATGGAGANFGVGTAGGSAGGGVIGVANTLSASGGGGSASGGAANTGPGGNTALGNTGGGCGGALAATPVALVASAGGSIMDGRTNHNNGAAPGTTGGVGTAIGLFGASGGGGGGSAILTDTAGNGGAGVQGSGGGGGGAALSTGTAGTGGAGGPGLVVVITYF